MVDKSLLTAIEEEDDEKLKKLHEWEKQDIEIAREIINDHGPVDRFITPPNKFEFHEYRQMERFIGTLNDPVADEKLTRAIKGKGRFDISRTPWPSSDSASNGSAFAKPR